MLEKLVIHIHFKGLKIVRLPEQFDFCYSLNQGFVLAAIPFDYKSQFLNWLKICCTAQNTI